MAGLNAQMADRRGRSRSRLPDGADRRQRPVHGHRRPDDIGHRLQRAVPGGDGDPEGPDRPVHHVYVVSIPDAYQLWSLFKSNWWARFIWSAGGICQSLLANPTSTQQVDVQRREEVRQRNIDYNTQLAQVCAAIRLAVPLRQQRGLQHPASRRATSPATTSTRRSPARRSSLPSAGRPATPGRPPPPPVAQDMRVGSLVGTRRDVGAHRLDRPPSRLPVADTGTAPVSGVTVTGTWSGGSGATTCTTDITRHVQREEFDAVRRSRRRP